MQNLDLASKREFILFFRSVRDLSMRAAVYFRKPTEEFGIFARRFSRQRQLFPIGLLRFLCRAIAKIPRQRIAVGGKLCVERLCHCDGHSVVQAAARSRRVPALEGVTGLDRRARRGGCRRIRLACRGDAGLAINGAAVRSGVPLDRQADSCTAIVALAVTVRVGVVSVFIARIAAGRARCVL